MEGSVALGPVVAAGARVSAADRNQAIRAAVGLLVDREAVLPTYADRCIGMVEEHGPYIVLAPGIALAHARPEDGVRLLCVSAVTLRHPVAFGHPTNDPVDVVLAFGSPDRIQHTALLADLARALMSGLADRLRAASTDAEATAILEEAAHHEG